MIRSKKIRPYAEFGFRCEPIFKQMGFRFSRVLFEKNSEGWLCLIISWQATDKEYLTRRAILDFSQTSSEGLVGVSLEFPELKFGRGRHQKAATIEAGIQAHPKILNRYRFSHVDFHKYEAHVWFHPDDWNQKTKTLFATPMRWTKGQIERQYT